MIVPALIYHFFNVGTPAQHGWGIPMATDIAFAVGALALLGPRVPLSLKVFLLALAIVDDLGAVLVIAFFYTNTISGTALGCAALLLMLIAAMNRAGIKTIPFYFVAGVFVWLCFLKSGVHATIAGVILGLMTPMAPLHKLERLLHPWVSFAIMPIFALANAGVTLSNVNLSDIVLQPVYLGVALGLLIGKPVGIFLFSFVSVKTKLASLPQGVSFKELFGTGMLGGIGFTMALFISGLAIKSHGMEIYSKTGILSGSIIAGALGYLSLRLALGSKRS
jgi:NhaA family Na+:H+ antiporter